MDQDKINVCLPNLIHEILIEANNECRGDKLILELTVASLKKVFNAEIENTLNVIRTISRLSEEEKAIIDKVSY